MTTTEPQVGDRDIFNIKQTAEVLGMHHNTVARKADQGAIIPIIGRESGKRFFTGKEIKRYWKER